MANSVHNPANLTLAPANSSPELNYDRSAPAVSYIAPQVEESQLVITGIVNRMFAFVRRNQFEKLRDDANFDKGVTTGLLNVIAALIAFVGQQWREFETSSETFRAIRQNLSEAKQKIQGIGNVFDEEVTLLQEWFTREYLQRTDEFNEDQLTLKNEVKALKSDYDTKADAVETYAISIAGRKNSVHQILNAMSGWSTAIALTVSVLVSLPALYFEGTVGSPQFGQLTNRSVGQTLSYGVGLLLLVAAALWGRSRKRIAVYESGLATFDANFSFDGKRHDFEGRDPNNPDKKYEFSRIDDSIYTTRDITKWIVLIIGGSFLLARVIITFFVAEEPDYSGLFAACAIVAVAMLIYVIEMKVSPGYASEQVKELARLQDLANLAIQAWKDKERVFTSGDMKVLYEAEMKSLKAAYNRHRDKLMGWYRSNAQPAIRMIGMFLKADKQNNEAFAEVGNRLPEFGLELCSYIQAGRNDVTIAQDTLPKSTDIGKLVKDLLPADALMIDSAFTEDVTALKQSLTFDPPKVATADQLIKQIGDAKMQTFTVPAEAPLAVSQFTFNS